MKVFKIHKVELKTCMSISAQEVMRLRALTGAPMMDCKRALDEAGGDIHRAAEILRHRGVVKAVERAERVAVEGMVAGAVSPDGRIGALVEANSETDFVGQSPELVDFAAHLAALVLEHDPADVAALGSLPLPTGQTVEEARTHLIATVGEKISIRRLARLAALNGQVALYRHGPQIGVLVEYDGGDRALGQDLAMQVAASRPRYVTREQVEAGEVAGEQAVYAEQLKAQSKPAAMIENIVRGKLEKFYGEVCLVEQPFIKDENVTVGQLIASKGAGVKRFVRFELGEGIARVAKNFAVEVAAQLG